MVPERHGQVIAALPEILETSVTLAELCEQLDRRAREAEQIGATAPVARVLRMVLGQLADLREESVPNGMINTRHAAALLGVKSKTVANWCSRGKIEGAQKTSDDGKGRWVIPADSIPGVKKPGRPKLWEG
jgi:hypothetical protein